MRVNSPWLGEVFIRPDIYRITHRSASGNEYAYTLCTDCLYKQLAKWEDKHINPTMWPKEQRVCGDCGAMNQPTFEHLSLLKKETLERRKGKHGKA